MNLDALIGGTAPLWASGETFDQYQVVKSPAASGALYIRITAAGSGATDPASDTTNYRPFIGRAIKSIQRGTITITNGTSTATATITSVDTAKTELRLLGSSTPGTGTSDNVLVRITLTNATTITATRGATANDVTVSWELTERY